MVFLFEGIDVLSCFFGNNFASLIKGIITVELQASPLASCSNACNLIVMILLINEAKLFPKKQLKKCGLQ